ncbi:FAD-dependent monooxygenase [Alcanivorax sp. JB21]|uniref:FAD-dependent oxidoreductase n=1 Tax=Alcanivorax limicola TaxID=2874102 RepID=UPI001CBF3AFF|nr:NAD(P)/FAD-dependent oxidoreductase [Alcanivorax limicola]MBZ2188010.1 FAD-dependent monooxygenase [Alcanivorax limicola]
MQRQHIAIIGAGTAGLATAIFLARQGHHITLIEQAPALTPVGAGILLQPAGLVVLDLLGLRDKALHYGARVDALVGDTLSGRTIMHTRYADLGLPDSSHGVGIHRASLCHILDQALAPLPHKRLMHTRVDSVAEQGRGVRLTLSRDGATDTLEADAVLIANGSNSQLRPPALVRYDRQYPWGALWTMQPCSEASTALRQRYDGCHTMAGILPTGITPARPDTPLVSVFWSLPVADMPAWRDGRIDLNTWRVGAERTWPDLAPLLAPLRSSRELIPATYRDVIMRRWAQGRIGVIGDAAHAMSPQLGQGANMALADALALAQALSNATAWPDAWATYHRLRTGPIRFYQRMSRGLTPVFQSHSRSLAAARDMAFPLMYAVPWLRKQMALTVAGLKTGLL